MSSSTETFTISAEQAEIYEAKFVPAIFAGWAAPLVDAAGVASGHAVLDVACGTGIVARTAAERVGPTGSVTGVDLNEGMLVVARRLRPDLRWEQGDVAGLPFDDRSFDVVLCQSSLMFFPDATGALREMARVCRPGGVAGIQVYSSLDAQPAYGPWVRMVARHAGPDALNLLGTYWVHGDLEVLSARCAAAGLEVVRVHDRVGTARFASVEDMVRTEIAGTPLADRLDAGTQQRILAESEEVLGAFRGGGGLDAPLAGHIVIARRR